MYSVETAARTNAKSLWTYVRCEHSRDDRVEERLGELGPLVVDEEADVEQLRAAPDRVVERARVELLTQPLDALLDPLVVVPDALPHRLLGLRPRSDLEAMLRAGTRLAEEPVVPIEALDHHGGDALRDLAGCCQVVVGHRAGA